MAQQPSPKSTASAKRAREPFSQKLRKFLRRLVYVFLAFVALIAIFTLAITQSYTFRSWLKDLALDYVNEKLEAKIELSDIGGNIISGLTLENLRIISANDTLLYARSLVLRYDIEPLFRESIVVNEATLIRPKIKLLKSIGDSSWNVAHITTSDDSDTASGQPFDWPIRVHGLRIVDGEFVMKDSTVPAERLYVGERVEFDNLHLQNLQLDIDASALLAENTHTVNIRTLAFYDPQSKFNLQGLSGTLEVDTTFMSVQDLRIRTSESDVTVTARLDDVNFTEGLDPEQWKTIPATIQLDAQPINVKDLQRFLPDLDFLGGSPSVFLEASGDYGALDIQRLVVHLKHSRLELQGKLQNLHTPSKLYIDADIARTKLQYADVLEHVPGLDIPDLGYLGLLRVHTASFVGEPENFRAAIRTESAIGALDIDCKLDVSGDTLVYDAVLATRQFDFGPPLYLADWHSSLTSDITIVGKGVSLDEMDTRVTLSSTTSSISEHAFKRLQLDIAANNGGLVTIDTLELVWDTPSFQQPVVANGSRLLARGLLNLRDPETPGYNLNVDLDRVDLEALIPGSDLVTDLSAKVRVKGEGLDPDSLTGSFNADIASFAIPTQTFEPFDIRASMLRKNDGSRSLRLRSGIANVDLQGAFTFEAVFNAINRQAAIIARTVDDRYQTLFADVAGALTPVVADSIRTLTASDSAAIDASFYVRLLDLRPLALVNTSSVLLCNAELQGTLRGSPLDNKLELDTSHIASFYYQAGETEFRFPPTKLYASTAYRYESHSVENLIADFSLKSDSTIFLDGLELHGADVQLSYYNDEVHFALYTDVDRIVDIRAYGVFDVSGNAYPIRFRTLDIGYQNDIHWTNNGEISAILTSEGIILDAMELRKDGMESLTLNGLMSFDEFDDAKITLKAFPLSDINEYLPTASRIEALDFLEGIVSDLNLKLDGPYENPVIGLELEVDSLRYNDQYVGRQVAALNYRDSVIKGSTSIYDVRLEDQEQTLSVTIGSLPLNLALRSVERRTVPGKPVSIGLDANSLPLALLDPFVPSITRLKGIANANFRIAGEELANADYLGSATIRAASFFVESTNIKYYAKGNISLRNDNVDIDTILLRNDPIDLPGGRGMVTGSARLSGFDIRNFDLYFVSKGLLAMSKASRSVSPNMYGPLIIATGDEALNFYGNLDSPYLSGDLNVRKADLTFPVGKTVKRSARQFCYETVIRSGGKTYITGRNCPPEMYGEASDPGAIIREQSDNDTETGSATIDSEPGLIDKIRYDIRIRLSDDVSIVMDFPALEKLTANVTLADPNAPLLYKTVGDVGNNRLDGGLRVKDNSEYIFIRNFKASGGLYFQTGEIDNPNLDLIAQYKGSKLDANGKKVRYEVTLKITGSKKFPQTRFSYTINGVRAEGDTAQVQKNAILLMTLGKTEDELKSAGLFSNIPGDLLQTGLANQASSLLTDVIQNAGRVITAVELDLSESQSGSGIDFSQARIVLSGELGGINFQYGSDFNNLGNSEFSLEIPLGAWFFNVGRSSGSGSATRAQEKEYQFKIGGKSSW